jgi:hypothetical protein
MVETGRQLQHLMIYIIQVIFRLYGCGQDDQTAAQALPQLQFDILLHGEALKYLGT